jgi:hypothetical protein
MVAVYRSWFWGFPDVIEVWEDMAQFISVDIRLSALGIWAATKNASKHGLIFKNSLSDKSSP